MNSLKELFEDTVRDVYSAEKQFVKAMPKLISAAQNERLKAKIADHLEQSKGHIQRLEQVADLCGFKPTGKVCKAAQGLVEETTEHLEEFEPGATLDAAIILCAQKNEHYEVCSYGTLAAWSACLGLAQVTELLEATLNEEKTADHLLTDVSRPILQESAASDPEHVGSA